MENNNIENYYNNIEKPFINNCINKLNLKNILVLSALADLTIFTKQKKNQWKLKDKRRLLKECDIIRNKTIKQVSSALVLLGNNKSADFTNKIKIKSDDLFNKIENIDSFRETIEQNYPTLSDEYVEVYSN
jgi:hypothetical protein